jgi:hypothetical protein
MLLLKLHHDFEFSRDEEARQAAKRLPAISFTPVLLLLRYYFGSLVTQLRLRHYTVQTGFKV